MTNINLPLPDEMLKQIDEARQTTAGVVPRVEWIRNLITQALAAPKETS